MEPGPEIPPGWITFFFILVVPLGVTSILGVILQPLAVGYWCSICGDCISHALDSVHGR